MLLECECRGVRLLACDLKEWDSQSDPPAKRVVDLRKVTEIDPATLAAFKDKGVTRVSLPVTGPSWSEQDMDALRREFLRGEPAVAVLSTGGTRAALMILQHVARVEKLSPAQALQKWPQLQLSDELKGLLQDYLARHARS